MSSFRKESSQKRATNKQAPIHGETKALSVKPPDHEEVKASALPSLKCDIERNAVAGMTNRNASRPKWE